MFKFVLFFIVFLCLLSCSSDPHKCVDIDGNRYRTVTIGNQIWMAENLKVTRYRVGEAIAKVQNDKAWEVLKRGAYAEFGNDPNEAAVYGRLYNWYAVESPNGLCPAGWRVPSDEDWKVLERHLGMKDADNSMWRGTIEGGKLKDTGTFFWLEPNLEATNETGFTALPGGYRHRNGNYIHKESSAVFWTSTGSGPGVNTAFVRRLSFNNGQIFRHISDKAYGYSVRCMKDL